MSLTTRSTARYCVLLVPECSPAEMVMKIEGLARGFDIIEKVFLGDYFPHRLSINPPTQLMSVEAGSSRPKAVNSFVCNSLCFALRSSVASRLATSPRPSTSDEAFGQFTLWAGLLE